MSTKMCPVCKINAVGKLNPKVNLRNGSICLSCWEAAGFKNSIKDHRQAANMIVTDSGKIEVQKNEEDEKREAFNPTKKVGNYLFLDEEKKQWVIPKGTLSGKIKNATIFSYDDIVDFELLEDGASVAKGGLGSAAVGGILFGGAGTIVGGAAGRKEKQVCTNLQIKITLNSITDPVTYINFIKIETKKDSFVYNTAYASAQEVLSILQLICNENNENVHITDNTSDTADEIKKFKELLDEGAITQEEFDLKKKQLLGL